nr:hypothetical protein CFP56_76534 [Quercus suber]
MKPAAVWEASTAPLPLCVSDDDNAAGIHHGLESKEAPGSRFLLSLERIEHSCPISTILTVLRDQSRFGLRSLTLTGIFPTDLVQRWSGQTGSTRHHVRPWKYQHRAPALFFRRQQRFLRGVAMGEAQAKDHPGTADSIGMRPDRVGTT